MMRKLFNLCAAVLILLAGCSSQFPLPKTFPQTYQPVLQSGHHWDVISKDTSMLVNTFLATYLPEGTPRKIFIQQKYTAENCTPNNECITPFDRAFKNMLTNHLANLGYMVVNSPADSLILQYETQVIRHTSDQHKLLANSPGLVTALTAGVLVLRESIEHSFSSLETWAYPLAAAVAVDFFRGKVVPSVPNTELIITSSLIREDTTIMGANNVYYFQEQDISHYKTRGGAGGIGPEYPSRNDCPESLTLAKGGQKSGCPTDSDGDGVIDSLDQCPGTPLGVIVDKTGCPMDTDGDGVYDSLDVCPGTPPGVIVDQQGCPLDSDGDGVPDYLDRCPNTPKGARVDRFGCVPDLDRDGVPDNMDLCPQTPAGVAVDKDGCPLDSDGDGVPDYKDKCPNTPKGVKVDRFGCQADTDRDGVPDSMDKCPNTPMNVKVDKDGCPDDSDSDGVTDLKDQCPGTPKGANVDELGCWVIGNVLFDFKKFTIKPQAEFLLNNTLDVLKNNPDLKIKIEGHTCNIGSRNKNNILSRQRADAVKNYLIKNGISANRLSAEGFGFTRPKASNKTEQGRILNRRVEFKPEHK